MNVHDRSLIDTLISSGKHDGNIDIYLVHKNGYILLGLPRDRQLALKVVGLYQPQKRKAKWLKRGLKLLVLLSLHRLLKRERISVGDASLITELDIIGKDFGFILSNASSENRNMMLLYQGKDGYSVMKAGDSHAHATLQKEYDISKQFSEFTDYVLEPKLKVTREHFVGYTTSYFVGKSPATSEQLKKVLTIPTEWLDKAQVGKISDTRVYDELLQHHYLKENVWQNLIKKIGDLELKLPIGHGDFCPWNILLDESGDCCILDWEFAELVFPPSWDTFHFIIQTQLLVEGKSEKEVFDYCLSWPLTTEGMSYCAKANISQCADLLGAYLVYYHYVLGMDRGGLINLWLKKYE